MAGSIGRYPREGPTELSPGSTGIGFRFSTPNLASEFSRPSAAASCGNLGGLAINSLSIATGRAAVKRSRPRVPEPSSEKSARSSRLFRRGTHRKDTSQAMRSPNCSNRVTCFPIRTSGESSVAVAASDVLLWESARRAARDQRPQADSRASRARPVGGRVSVGEFRSIE
jgi:hypothetical protein